MEGWAALTLGKLASSRPNVATGEIKIVEKSPSLGGTWWENGKNNSVIRYGNGANFASFDCDIKWMFHRPSSTMLLLQSPAPSSTVLPFPRITLPKPNQCIPVWHAIVCFTLGARDQFEAISDLSLSLQRRPTPSPTKRNQTQIGVPVMPTATRSTHISRESPKNTMSSSTCNSRRG